MKGNIKEISSKYGVSYNALRQSYHRTMSHTTEGSVSRSNVTESKKDKPSNSNISSKKQPVDVHGSIWWTCRLPSLDLMEGLPWHGKGNRGWKGIVTPSVTMEVFKNGRVKIHDHASDWRIVLVKELRECGWSDEQISWVLDELRLHGEELHVAQRNPNAPDIDEYSCDGTIHHFTDGTPWYNKSEELVAQLKQYFDNCYSEIHSLPKTLGLIMGGMPIPTVLSNMMLIMDKMVERISALEQKGLQPGASPPGIILPISQTTASMAGSKPGAKESPDCSPSYDSPQIGIEKEESSGSLTAAGPAKSNTEILKEQLLEEQGITPDQDPADIPQSTLHLPPPARPRHCPHICADPSFSCFKCLACSPARVIGYVSNGTLEPSDEFLEGSDLVCRNHYENCRFYPKGE